MLSRAANTGEAAQGAGTGQYEAKGFGEHVRKQHHKRRYQHVSVRQRYGQDNHTAGMLPMSLPFYTPPPAARAATSPELMKLSASMANTNATIPTAAALAVATELRPHITQLAPPAVRPQATLSTSAVICSTIPGNHHTPTCAGKRCSSRSTRGKRGGGEGGGQQKPQHASISMSQPGWQAPRPGYDGACSRVLEPLMHQTVDAPMLAKAYTFHDVTHQHLRNISNGIPGPHCVQQVVDQDAGGALAGLHEGLPRDGHAHHAKLGQLLQDLCAGPKGHNQAWWSVNTTP